MSVVIRKRSCALVLPLLALLLAGCAGMPAWRSYALPAQRIELTTTPFFAQADYQCGPAALATVLVASGVAVTPEDLVPQVYLPARKGSIQAEMIAATRVHGRVPYVLEPAMKPLLDEVAAGTPVLVLLNLGLRFAPQWHYAVVIGYDVAADSLLLRSGTKKDARMSRHRFLSSWSRAGNWALVAAAPGQPPLTANSSDWLQDAVAFEELRQPAIAAAAYAAATQRWPDDPLTWQTLANARYALHDLPGTEAALRQSLLHTDSAAAHNNLAQVLLERHCVRAAGAEIARALAAADAPAFAAALGKTQTDIAAAGNGDAADCP